MSESSGASFRFVEYFFGLPCHVRMGGNNHLANPLAVVYCERFVRQVHQNNADLAAIIGIDRTRRVQQRNPVFERQSATRTYLSLVSFGQCDE